MKENRTVRVADENVGETGDDLSKYDDGFPDPESFNAAISEASGSCDLTTFDEDFDTGDDNDDVPTFETLPEWEIIVHNLSI